MAEKMRQPLQKWAVLLAGDEDAHGVEAHYAVTIETEAKFILHDGTVVAEFNGVKAVIKQD
jgi:hypothetical protein